MAAPARLSIPPQWKHEEKPIGGQPFSAESACAQTPLTSEPPLPDAEPLTSEPPMADATPLTSESDPVPDCLGPGL
ncbi:hypothetical protein [Streptomyces sp. AF1A]|uniref:hypothetical protein n=1 Tax=Streptomyces sp. AF1A TaxID=3394350 RepID=UPI0039BC8A50